MRYAIISDIHSNLEALTKVLSEIEKRGVDHVICLGDVVGYGANPSECLELVGKVASETVMGNHDQAIEDLELRNYFNGWAREAIDWTATVLSEDDKRLIRDFVPVVIDRKANVTWAHGSLHQPEEYHYLFNEVDAIPSFNLLETEFCFFGHTHVPSLFSEREKNVQYLPAGSYQLPKGDRFLLNPGSVGQPRDKNPKLSFAVFDSQQRVLEIIRLKYDNHKAARKIRKAKLPEYLAARLL
jgi:predicted phosphodiesterase